jgi:predicted dehydrogenase
MTFFTWRWMPHIRYMRELINEGAIGQVFHCKLSFVSGYGRNPQYQWRFDRKRANGVVGDFGPHMFDQARYLVGEITRVNAHLTANFQREAPLGGSLDPANDSAMVLLEFAGGAHGLAELSAVARVDDTVFEQQIAVHGEAGSIVADLRLDTGPKLRIARGNEPLKPLSIPERFLGGIDSSQPFVTQIIPMFIQQPIGCRLFVDNLLEGRGTVPSFYDGWKAQQVIDAAVTSSETAQWMNIPG